MTERPPQAAATAEGPWTVRRVLGWTTQHFEKKNIDAPRLTAELLLSHVLKASRVRLYVDLDRPLDPEELKSFRALISRRMEGEPTQYLTGVRDFYNRAFKVDARVLVPRPETELLVDRVLERHPKDATARVLDLCTGSGCIAITLAAERAGFQVVATDLSPDALTVARENASTLGMTARVTFAQGDLFDALTRAGVDGPFDVLVSNPPYVTRAELPTLSPEVRKEPVLALDGGADGLDLIRRIAAEAPRWLGPGGLLALEIGETQGAAVKALLVEAGFTDVRIEKDWERRERHAFGTRAA